MATARAAWSDMPAINRDLLAPLQSTSRGYLLLVVGLAALVAVGAGAWYYQIETGIGRTNMHPPIFWGAYIASFVYWIGVSHSGTFISGVLRLTKAQWRRPGWIPGKRTTGASSDPNGEMTRTRSPC